MSTPLSQHSKQKRIQERSREEANEHLRLWAESLNWCRCAKPIRDRRYLGRWACRFCGQLIR